MRKSAAPSQVKRNVFRAPFLSPPYRVPIKKLAVENTAEIENSLASNTAFDKLTSQSSKTSSASHLLNIVKSSETKTATNDTEILESAVNPPTDSFVNSYLVQSDNKQSLQNDSTSYFSVVWCKLSKKKHKKWEGDAILIVKGRSVILKDMEGKEIGRSSGYKLKDLESLEEGNTLPVGAKEIEIQNKIDSVHYLTGKCFQSCPLHENTPATSSAAKPKPKPFRLPLKNASNNPSSCHSNPLYDVKDANAIVLPKPPPQHQWAFNSDFHSIVDTVIDPHLGCHLRPHQEAGVIFMYECVMGFRRHEFSGCILADEMGLGKTLQCITLIWTLLKQGPYGGRAVLNKVLIVVPSSLIGNWTNEFSKWLGKERVTPFVADQSSKVKDFEQQTNSRVLIMSYEMLMRCVDLIERIHFDLLLCDEGHRLKNGQIKTSNLLNHLNIKRKILLTGTPIQNDFQELYALAEFVNPGVFGSSSMFRKVYEEPILKAQQPLVSNEDKELGMNRAAELSRLTSQFILRRTQEIINKYLPPKTELVVFCQPSESQSNIYQSIVSSVGLQRCLYQSEVGDHLAAICVLRKLCNHPSLLRVGEDKEQATDIQSEITSLLPRNSSQDSMEEDSGKLAVVSCLLWSLAESKREKIVIVSNFTTTLDLLQKLCERYQYPFLRLDGSTPTARRQHLVDRFNSHPNEFVFLLSAKAGGLGLNLVGASRILLFDIDWNPATDLQAMARVWRDGQRKHVYIYRLLLAGSIEEKMYQRQVCKQGISGCVVDARSNAKAHFSLEELKDLFQFYPDVSCLTHDSLQCPCDQLGGESQPAQTMPLLDREYQLGKKKVVTAVSKTKMDQLFNWQHYAMPGGAQMIHDEHLQSASDFISFIFKCDVTQPNTVHSITN